MTGIVGKAISDWPPGSMTINKTAMTMKTVTMLTSSSRTTPLTKVMASVPPIMKMLEQMQVILLK